MHSMKQSESDSQSSISFPRVHFLQAPPLPSVIKSFGLTLHARIPRQDWHSSTFSVASQVSLTSRRTWRANHVPGTRRIFELPPPWGSSSSLVPYRELNSASGWLYLEIKISHYKSHALRTPYILSCHAISFSQLPQCFCTSSVLGCWPRLIFLWPN